VGVWFRQVDRGFGRVGLVSLRVVPVYGVGLGFPLTQSGAGMDGVPVIRGSATVEMVCGGAGVGLLFWSCGAC